MAYVIFLTPIEERVDKFNRLVNLSLNSKDCCCENKYLAKLYAIMSLEYELERYYKYNSGDTLFTTGSPARIRRDKISEAIISILDSVCEKTELLQNITDNQISYADIANDLWRISKSEYKLGKEKCWCNILKSSLAFQLDQTPDIYYSILNSENRILVDKIIAQSSVKFIPNVDTINVNEQVLTP